MASPAPTHITLNHSPRVAGSREVSAGSTSSLELISARALPNSPQGGLYARDNLGRPIIRQRWVHVAYDVLQVNANGAKERVRIGARPVQRNHDPSNPIVWKFSYLSIPQGSEQWAPAPPIPDNDFRHFIAHNMQTAGQFWIQDLACVSSSREEMGNVSAGPRTPAQRQQMVHQKWLAAHNNGTLHSAVYDHR